MSRLDVSELPFGVHDLRPIERAMLAEESALAPLLRAPLRLADVEPPRERFEPEERALLARAIEASLARHEPHVAVLDSARALAEPGASIVLVEREPCFLGGAVEHVWAALHAVRLARSLAADWRAPVVPVLWNDADSHELARASHVFVQNEHLDLRRVGLPGAGSSRVPLGRLALDEERHRLGAVRALLAQLLADAPHHAEAIATLAPRAGETVAGAYTRAMLEIAGPLGLVVIEPDALREELSRALAEVVLRDPAALLGSGAARLAGAGLEARVEPAGAPLAYALEGGGASAAGRRALRAGGDGFRYDDEEGSRTATELAAEIVQSPGAWSAGAALLPVIRARALPIAVRVCDADELALEAQLGPLRAALSLPAAQVVRRQSVTLVDAATAESLRRVGLDAADAIAAAGELARSDRPAPPEVVERLRAVAREAGDRLLALREAMGGVDRGLAVQLKRNAQRFRDETERLCVRAERAAQNRSGKHRRHLRRIDACFAPLGGPQERALALLQVLARHGRDWIEALPDALDAVPRGHLVVALREAAPSEG